MELLICYFVCQLIIHCTGTTKLKSVKIRQSSKEGGVRFVAFKSKEFENCKYSKVPLTSRKATSIHFLAHNKFLILDSVGELYLLLLSNIVSGSESTCDMKKLTLTMKVQNLAVLPDDSTSMLLLFLFFYVSQMQSFFIYSA